MQNIHNFKKPLFRLLRIWKDSTIKKNALHLSVNVFSTKVLIEDTIFTSPNRDGTAI